MEKQNSGSLKMGKLWCLVLLGCCVVAAASGVGEEHARVRRRVKPKPKKPLTLEELNYEVHTASSQQQNVCVHVDNATSVALSKLKLNRHRSKYIIHVTECVHTKISVFFQYTAVPEARMEQLSGQNERTSRQDVQF